MLASSRVLSLADAFRRAVFECQGDTMAGAIKAGTIMMQAGTLIPQSVRVEAEPYSHDWGMLKDSDSNILDHNLRGAGWSFFFLAARIQAIAWGKRGETTVRRAVTHVLTKVKSLRFNCLEITEITTKRFLGLPYVRVSAHPRHIQKDPFLQSCAKRSRAEMAAATAVGLVP
jgi:hypothetical protein